MAELADAADSKSAGLRPLGVRLPLPAPALTPGAVPSVHLSALLIPRGKANWYRIGIEIEGGVLAPLLVLPLQFDATGPPLFQLLPRFHDVILRNDVVAIKDGDAEGNWLCFSFCPGRSVRCARMTVKFAD